MNEMVMRVIKMVVKIMMIKVIGGSNSNRDRDSNRDSDNDNDNDSDNKSDRDN